MLELAEAWYFVRPATALSAAFKSPAIHCGDVADRFPCPRCGAGKDGRPMRCADLDQANKDLEALEKWRGTEAPLTESGKAWLGGLRARAGGQA